MHWKRALSGTLAAAATLCCIALLGATDAVQESTKSLNQAGTLSAEQDHERIMQLLHITALRRGADGDPKSPDAANMDESKANTFGSPPDPLLLKNGKKVASAEIWWKQRRAEIVEDFEREIYGR